MEVSHFGFGRTFRSEKVNKSYYGLEMDEEYQFGARRINSSLKFVLDFQ